MKKNLNKNLGLDHLFLKWCKELTKDNHFCKDGLMYKANNNEEELWENSKRKILFLLKENHVAEVDEVTDIREWACGEEMIKGSFFKRLSSWLYGLMNATKEGYPSFDEASDPVHRMKAQKEYPFAWVNVKKQIGSSKSYDKDISYFGKQHKSYLIKQINILNPNIIVAGDRVIFQILQDTLFKNSVFEEINNWLYFIKDKNLVIIDSYHPAARKNNNLMYNEVVDKIVDFLNKKSTLSSLAF